MVSEIVTRIPEQIDIMINTECNAHCEMCIQEVTYKPDTEDGFLESVSKHVGEFYDAGGRRVIITGGEPTLRLEKVLGVLQELKAFSELELVAMYTNGSRLLERKNRDVERKLADLPYGMCTMGTRQKLHREGKKTLTQRLYDGGLDMVNLSMHHYEREKNNDIFKRDIPLNGILEHFQENKFPFRCCATLQKTGLETADDIVRYVDFVHAMGAEDVYFRELFQVVDVDADGSRLRYLEENKVPLSPIIDELLSKGWKEENRKDCFQGRNKAEVLLHSPDGFPVYFSSLEIGTESRDDLPYLVVMPNGKLYSTWLGEEFQIESIKNII